MLSYVGLTLYLVHSLFRPADWYGPLQGAPVLYFSFGLMVLSWLSAANQGAIGATFKSQQVRLAGLFALLSLGGLLLHGEAAEFIPQFVGNLQMLAVLVAFGICANSVPKIHFVLVLMVLLVSIIAYQAIGQLATGLGWAGQGMIAAGRINWTGMYDGPNVLCMLFVIAVSFAIHLVTGPWGMGTKIICIVGGLLIANGIYLTNSRGGYLAFIVVCGLSMLLRGNPDRKRSGFLKLAAAVAGVALLLLVAPSRMDALNDEEHSTEGRIGSWQEGLEMLRESPLLGVGKGQWTKYHLLVAHNSFVQTFGETGVVGLFFWLAWLWLIVKTLMAILAQSDEPKERSLAKSILVAFCGFLAASFFLTTTQFDLTSIFGGLTLALSNQSGGGINLRRNDFCKIGIAAIGIVGVVYLTVRIFTALG